MTSPLSHDAFDDRRLAFEEGYFRTKDASTVEKLRKVFNTRKDKATLAKECGITSDQVLERLVALSIKGELLTAFKLYPLVEIAWADGSVDPRETKAVMEAAVRLGVPKDGTAIQKLGEWLQRGPTADGRTAWYAFAAELRKTLTPKELDGFRADLLRYAKTVAEASGGILGIVFQISPSEAAVLDKVAKALTAGAHV